ncbi:PREDICTED: putative disease resistance protein RGA3 [Lupinus angustifolius]|uniref:putative disease resistance protein RGA3 n=1 Tax=Lupinus angustifolius TaxID=3871 RepID=UPI00092E88CA|nr:PREDICTED: putative disease resistance protein RGA3 [Lupinus angustifolius]XP_019445229.1 PREDICTED: putative disease resistance protein RGA3 [Lupinus angustifolius]
MAEALLLTVLKSLSTFIQQEAAMYWSVHQQAEKLNRYLTEIRAVLLDAEEQQVTNNAVKLWLQKLTDAALVVDDILEDSSIQPFQTESLGLCGWLTRFHPSNILYRINIGKRMNEITHRFDVIDEERRKFEFRPATIIIERQPQVEEWRQTTSAISEEIVYGRDKDREMIIDFLINHASKNEELSIYPIVGMGGLGKTTLAQLVFKDDRLTHFELKIWVCVSDDFQITRILKSILESITEESCNLSTLEAIGKKVQKVLQSKKYLLVLDDVWNENQDKWNKLKSLLQCGNGTKGASILVTTRLNNVASLTGTCYSHKLSGLSNDDNWSLFKHHAFGPNNEECEELVAIGMEIARKCAGSPLASRALGSLLSTKREENQWLNIKNSKLWDIQDDKHIMPALRLSYFNLSLPARQCFSFCAIFPKGFKIGKEQLIHLWMANGFIQSTENLEVEDVGYEVWNELYQRSFFQEVETDATGDITFKIHDLFHDLAQSIMGAECKVSKAEELTNLSSRVHHMGCLSSSKLLDMSAFKNVESLRTFLEIDSWLVTPSQIPPFSHLRALQTRGAYEFSALENLTHLRYLHIYRSNITTLPESLCQLQKLQILKLESCLSLNCLPQHLTQLQDLRHLVIKRCDKLVALPPNIGKLKCLKTLSTFIVDSRPGFGLAELHDLQLGGKLHIRGLENVKSESDARQSNLVGKKYLNCLCFSWDGNANSQGAGVDARSILEALQPHSNLKSLELNGYQGIRFPSWMRNPSLLQGLVDVTLNGCLNCKGLPPLGKLPHLTTLQVYSMREVHYIDDDSYDNVSLKPFKSLKKLTLGGLPNLERMLRDNKVEMLPLLSELRIRKVPKFQLPYLPSITYLDVEGIENASFFSQRYGPCLKFLRISHFNLKVFPNAVGSLNALKELQIDYCQEIESLPENVLQGLASLRTLLIGNCDKLKSLPDSVGHLSSLERLIIRFCRELASLPSSFSQLQNLKQLAISGCPGLMSLPSSFSQLTILKQLAISDCPGLTSLPDEFSQLINLQQLAISHCSGLTSLPISFSQLTNLQKLLISNCHQLVSLPNSFSQLTSLKQLAISCCPGLTSLPSSFSKPTNMEELAVSNCPGLMSLPRSISQLTNLQELAISRCLGLTSLPDSFSQLTNLKQLSISDCRGLSSLPSSFSQLTNLQQLVISNCLGLKSLPDSFSKLTNLEELFISYCHRLMSLPSSFSHLTNLKRLEISGCDGLTSLPSSFSQLTNLQQLVISNCRGLTSMSDNFSQLTILQQMVISDCHRLMSLPSSFSRRTNSKRVEISGCPGLTSLPSSFLQLTNLQQIVISNCPRLKSLPSIFPRSRTC